MTAEIQKVENLERLWQKSKEHQQLPFSIMGTNSECLLSNPTDEKPRPCYPLETKPTRKPLKKSPEKKKKKPRIFDHLAVCCTIQIQKQAENDSQHKRAEEKPPEQLKMGRISPKNQGGILNNYSQILKNMHAPSLLQVQSQPKSLFSQSNLSQTHHHKSPKSLKTSKEDCSRTINHQSEQNYGSKPESPKKVKAVLGRDIRTASSSRNDVMKRKESKNNEILIQKSKEDEITKLLRSNYEPPQPKKRRHQMSSLLGFGIKREKLCIKYQKNPKCDGVQIDKSIARSSSPMKKRNMDQSLNSGKASLNETKNSKLGMKNKMENDPKIDSKKSSLIELDIYLNKRPLIPKDKCQSLKETTSNGAQENKEKSFIKVNEPAPLKTAGVPANKTQVSGFRYADGLRAFNPNTKHLSSTSHLKENQSRSNLTSYKRFKSGSGDMGTLFSSQIDKNFKQFSPQKAGRSSPVSREKKMLSASLYHNQIANRSDEFGSMLNTTSNSKRDPVLMKKVPVLYSDRFEMAKMKLWWCRKKDQPNKMSRHSSSQMSLGKEIGESSNQKARANQKRLKKE